MKKRRVFLTHCLLLLLIVVSVSWIQDRKPAREYYQLTVYRHSTTEQEKVLDKYLENALLPAYHRMGIKHVGVFKSLANDTVAIKQLYVFLPLKSFEMAAKFPENLLKDQVYQSEGADYINAVYTTPPYTRVETILLKAFSLAPKMQLPNLKSEKKERVYEMRSYESATEKIYQKKVHMFNEGDEIGLFKRLNFNAVFYSEVVAGSKMPNLMYMTCFENMADRDAHWKNFVSDEQWKKLSSMQEYKNTVSRNEISLLRPTDYSDF